MRRSPLLALTAAFTTASVVGIAGNAHAQNAAGPRLVSPMSTARVTSMRPTLHWAGGDGDVDICRDRACGTVVVTFPGHGGSGAPTADLPAGNVFWRVRAGAATSAVWEFSVPTHTAATDTSWGSSTDVNGDGFADVIVPGANGVSVFLGGGSGVSTTAAATISAPRDAQGYAWSLVSAGDVNGDGFGDVAIGSFSSNKVWVFLGGAGGLAATPAATLTGPNDSLFGTVVSSAGDVNRDGYGDLIVGAPKANSAVVFLGSATGLSATSTRLAAPEHPHKFGYTVAGIGDVNGDGRGDVAVGALDNAVYVYLGGESGITATPAATLNVAAPCFGTTISGDDVNGDGMADLIVGAPGTSALFVYPGSAQGVATTALTRLQGAANSGFGFTAAGIGDVNRDGFADVLVSTGTAPVVLHSGGAHGLADAATATLSAADTGEFGSVASAAGDVNGDGFVDAVVFGRRNGSAQVFLGSDTGLNAAAAITLHGPTAAATAHLTGPTNVPDTDDR